MALINRILTRSDTAANWTSANPTLAAGEAGWETDNKALKIGDGSTAWNALAYASLEQRITQAAAYTTVSGSTALQALFNSVAAGSLTVVGSMLYEFECLFYLNAMSASSGTFSFGLGGTATFTSCNYASVGKKAASPAPAEFVKSSVATITALVSASTSQVGEALVKGQFRTNAGGTVIP